MPRPAQARAEIDPRLGAHADLRPSGFFALRAPLLAFDELARLSDDLVAIGAATESSGSAVAGDLRAVEERLVALVRRAEIREALFVASPSLDAAIEAWLADRTSPRAQGVALIVLRYVARMAARSTPFGLFSGCSVGGLGAAETRLALGPFARHTRLDMHYLCALTDALERDATLRARLIYRPSSGLYASGAQLRYAEARVDPTTRERSYHLVSVERTEYLDAALERARDGASAKSIAEAIVALDPSLADDVDGYLDALIDSQILVSNLAPCVTGPEPVLDVVAALRAAESPVADALDEARVAIAAIDASGLGVPAARYLAIKQSLDALPAEADLARLFQVDLFRRAGPALAIGGEVEAELGRAMHLLAKLAVVHDDAPLKAFRSAFIERFEQREVSLVDALDEERGVGFDGSDATADPLPLLDGLTFPSPKEDPSVRLDARARHLRRKLEALWTTAASTGAREWSLDEADLRALAPAVPVELPGSLALFCVLAAPSPEALNQGDFELLVQHASGPSGATLLGRFCHGDAALRELVERHLRAEEARRPDAIFAEIVHLPEGRLGNILCRPPLREHEIAYLGRSGVAHDKQLTIDDLRVSVRGDRVVLRSARLDREVIPRLTSAHNFSMSELGIYRFLCALQQQETNVHLGWSWAGAEGARSLPRVRYGRIVLKEAQWRLDEDELSSFGAATSLARFEAAQALRRTRGLPRWIGLVDGDNVLPIDLDNALSIETFAELVKRRKETIVRELWPAPGGRCVVGQGGRYVHELVVPFERIAPAHRGVTPVAPVTKATPRSFSPGSEWLYAKLYCGTASSDDVLREVVAPARERALATGAATKWFFLRYGDPDWHVRLRFKGDPARLLAEVLPHLHELAAPFFEHGAIRKVVLDTYDREVERYGGDAGIEASEELFFHDSEAVLAILSQLAGDSGNDARWRLALLGAHRLMGDLGLDADARLQLVAQLRRSFGEEHGVDVAFERELGARYRVERAGIEELLAASVGSDHALEPGIQALSERSRHLVALGQRLRDRGLDLTDLAGSYVHMHTNRLLRSEARKQELVLYDFLLRYEESARARAKRSVKSK
jgi:thiopeptide-type bacteriocin biosynthesis protein